jgi:hypothetical protein
MPPKLPSHKRFRLHYPSLLRFAITFALVVLIAAFFQDPWIRPLLGDVLIVMVIAYFIHAFVSIPLRQIAIGTLIFAYFIEFLQFLKIIDLLGWRDSQLAHLTIGSTFDWRDLVAYTVGVAIVIMADAKRRQ